MHDSSPAKGLVSCSELVERRGLVGTHLETDIQLMNRHAVMYSPPCCFPEQVGFRYGGVITLLLSAPLSAHQWATPARREWSCNSSEAQSLCHFPINSSVTWLPLWVKTRSTLTGRQKTGHSITRHSLLLLECALCLKSLSQLNEAHFIKFWGLDTGEASLTLGKKRSYI